MTGTAESDQELARVFASENSTLAGEAFSELMKRHTGVFVGTCRRSVGSHRQDAEDLFQEFSTRLLKNRSQYVAERGAWKTWATKVLKNLARDWMAKRRTHDKHFRFNNPQTDLATHDGTSAEQTTIVRKMADDSFDCLQGIDDEDVRLVFLMRVQLGWTLRQIQTVLQMKDTSAVDRAARRGQVALRQCLESKGWTDGDLNS